MFVDYEHGLHGNLERALNLAEILPALRGDDGAPLITVVAPNLRHNALLNPWREAADIEQAFALTSDPNPAQSDLIG